MQLQNTRRSQARQAAGASSHSRHSRHFLSQWGAVSAAAAAAKAAKADSWQAECGQAAPLGVRSALREPGYELSHGGADLDAVVAGRRAVLEERGERGGSAILLHCRPGQISTGTLCPVVLKRLPNRDGWWWGGEGGRQCLQCHSDYLGADSGDDRPLAQDDPVLPAWPPATLRLS